MGVHRREDSYRWQNLRTRTTTRPVAKSLVWRSHRLCAHCHHDLLGTIAVKGPKGWQHQECDSG